LTANIVIAVVWGIVVAGAGAFLTDLTPWYRGLRKPSWQPPDWLFGPAWTVILSLASYSLYLALRDTPELDNRLLFLGLFVLNGILNVVWSPLFFRWRRPDWALAEVPFLWLSILAPMLLLMPVSSLAGWLLLPYLAWVSFASFLNFTIVRLNRPFGR
jgi:tryptophan-rich sensory protein